MGLLQASPLKAMLAVSDCSRLIARRHSLQARSKAREEERAGSLVTVVAQSPFPLAKPASWGYGCFRGEIFCCATQRFPSCAG